MRKIGILDYEAGNLGSVSYAFQRIGANTRVVKTARQLEASDGLVIPGVGSFGTAMERLDELKEPITRFAESGRPVLGICLGMQVLFQYGTEGGNCRGLGLLEGRVNKLENTPKLPHTGWNQVELAEKSALIEGLKQGECFYFVHSYACQPSNKRDILAFTGYGGRFVSAVARRNVFGVQFHPEKSGGAGERLLENFWKMV